MSYRIQGISNAFKKAAAANANRTVGQLVRINAAGEATNALGEDNLLFFPLIKDFNFADSVAVEAQVTGIAMVYVETLAGITAGFPVGPGATGVGIRQAQEGEFVLGFALKTPTVVGQLIPVLLAPQPVADSLY